MTIEKKDENPGIAALKRASRIAEENGIADMSLDEINAEIAETRRM
jgi:DNA-damage-inducible protein J